MSKGTLPIDVVPNTSPPRFRWSQMIQTPTGPRMIEHEGVLPPSVEGAVLSLITLAKRRQKDNDTLHERVADLSAEVGVLREQNNGHAARIASQSEALSTAAERQEPTSKRRK